jgi:transcriptional regulator with XRE-family HTH domain
VKYTEIAEYMTDWRAKTKLTQKEVAEKVNCNSQQVSNWERGLCPVPSKYIRKIAKTWPNFQMNTYIQLYAKDKFEQNRSKIRQAI